MTVKIRKVASYTAACDECSAREVGYNAHHIADWADKHEASHERWKVIGASLDPSSIFDARNKEAPYVNYVGDAEAIARDAGFPFLSWNGRIYPVGAINFEAPLCRDEDVPSLIASR